MAIVLRKAKELDRKLIYLKLRLVIVTLFAGVTLAFTIPLAMQRPRLPQPRIAIDVLGSMFYICGVYVMCSTTKVKLLCVFIEVFGMSCTIILKI